MIYITREYSEEYVVENDVPYTVLTTIYVIKLFNKITIWSFTFNSVIQSKEDARIGFKKVNVANENLKP